jgi:hypothetical protein
MKKYLNRNNNSGVSHFEIYLDKIAVKFTNTNKIYSYSYAYAGKSHVDKMKILAERGHGLNTYIKTNVNNLYDK